MWFNQYPYLNVNDLNLDFILKNMRLLEKTIKDFVALETIKYADPFQWNITTQYAKNTIVIDPNSGVAYLSVQPVPSGVLLSNTDYWTIIFDLRVLVDKFNDNLTHRNDHDNTNATFASSVGDWLILNDMLYEVIVAIPIGNTYIAGYNIHRVTVEDAIVTLSNTLYDTISRLDTAIDNITIHNDHDNTLATFPSAVGDWLILNDILYKVIVAIGLGDTYIAGYNITHTTIEDEMNALVSDYQNADTLLQNQINTINTTIAGLDNIATFKEIFKNKKVVILGDSLSVANVTWVAPFTTLVQSIGGSVDNFSVAGAGAATVLSAAQALTDTYDIAIVWCGVNDSYLQHALGDTTSAGTFAYVYKDIIDTLYTNNANMTIYCLGVSTYINNYTDDEYNPAFYSACIRSVANLYGAIYKDVLHLPRAGFYKHNSQTDGLHFTESYSKTYLLYAIISSLGVPKSDVIEEVFRATGLNFTAGASVALGATSAVHKVGELISIEMTIVTSAALSSGAVIATLPTNWQPPAATWFSIVGSSESKLGLTNGLNLTLYNNLPAGTYYINLEYVPRYANAITLT